MKIKNKKITSEKPTLFYATQVELRFEFETLLHPAQLYTLAIGSKRSATAEKMALATALPEGNTLTFNLDTFTGEFAAQVKNITEAWIEIHAGNEVLLSDQIHVGGRVDVDGVPPAIPERYPTREEIQSMIDEAVSGSGIDDFLEGSFE